MANYEDDIYIDEGELALEWLDQATRMKKYCDLAAEAHREMDLAKEQLDFVWATIERNVRAAPAAYGVIPGSRGITEDSIKAAIQVNDEYQEAVKNHINAKYENDVAVGAVRAFDQRKTALENLVRLHGQQYFAGPSAPRDLTADRRQREQSIQSRVRIGSRAPSQAPYISTIPRPEDQRTLGEARMGPMMRRRS